jgi:hypothetical protein
MLCLPGRLILIVDHLRAGRDKGREGFAVIRVQRSHRFRAGGKASRRFPSSQLDSTGAASIMVLLPVETIIF